MPAVVIGAVASAAAASATAFAAGTLTVGAFASSFAISLALGGLSTLLQPKIEKPDLSSFASIKQNGATRQFRQAVTERRLVYGEARVSGPILFVASTNNNRFLHLVIALASHEVDSIDELVINDLSVPVDYLNGSGMITQGRYANLIRVKKHLGSDDQTADSDLVSEVSEWTDDHRLRGIAYIYVRCKWDRDAFPSGIPNFSAWVKGKKLIDTREVAINDVRIDETGDTRVTEDDRIRETEVPTSTATRTWSPNLALIATDYMTYAKYGLNIPLGDIDDSTVDGTANLCDEMVSTKNVIKNVLSADASTDILTLDGEFLEYFRGDEVVLSTTSIGGTDDSTSYYVIPYQRHGTPRIKLASTLDDALSDVAIDITSDGTATALKTQEPRYHGGGLLKMSAEEGRNLEEILSGMGGKAIRVGSKWFLQGAEYQTPLFSYDESDLVGNISTQTKISKRDRFNQVQGVYLSQINGGNPSDYPVVQSSQYMDDDGETLARKLDLSFTQRPQTAQRIAKTELERARQEIRFNARFKLTAFKVRTGDNIMFSFDRYGWEDKIFEVIEWKITVENNVPYIDMTCRENASAVYDFTSADDETTVDPAPNTNLPDVFTVDAVTGFNLDSIPVSTTAGDTTYKIRAGWESPENDFVISGGSFEIQSKLDTESTYISLGLFDGNSTSADIFQGELDTQYDVRIRAINSLGRASNFVTIEEFVVGLTGGITAREDWENLTEARNPDDWESDTESSEDFE